MDDRIIAGLVADLDDSVREAGRLAMTAFAPQAQTRAEIFWKAGGSPVTAMDHAVDALIAARIDALNAAGHPAGHLSLHSEERPDSWTGDAGGLTIVLDPIDGTRAFASGGDDWCIALGLLRAGEPVGGIIHVPVRDEFYVASRGHGAFINGNRVTIEGGHRPIRATGPRGTLDQVSPLLRLPIEAARPISALAYRLVRPLAGDLDLALARSGSHDWDLVAADCILREAGGALLTGNGEAARYSLTGAAQPALFGGARALLAALLSPETAPSGLTRGGQGAKRGG